MSGIYDLVSAVSPIEDIGQWNPGDYHGTGGLSSSQIKDAAKSMRLFKAKYIDKTFPEKEKSDSLVVGDLLHHKILEPEKVKESFVMWEGGNRNKARKEWSEFKKEHVGRTIVTPFQWSQTERMAESFFNNEDAVEILQGSSKLEAAYRWKDEHRDLILKTKFDMWSEDYWADIKTTKSPSPADFKESMLMFGYDLSSALYHAAHYISSESKGAAAYFICVRNSAPYEVAVYDVRRYVERGVEKLLQTLERISVCKSTGIWKDEWENGITILD